MKTDKLFYKIFLSQPDLILELLPDIPADCEFEYSAPVVKEVEIRLDGLLTPISSDLGLPLVFFEAQMQSDADFYGRYFGGIYLYLRQYKANRPLDNPPSDVEFQRRLDLVEAILVNKLPQLSFEEVRQMLDLKEVNFSEDN